MAKKDIVDTAVAAGSFKPLVAAVKAARLVDTLKGKGPFTVFAPTDEAFPKLPKGTVESLLKPENKSKLVDILKFHVVAAKVPAAKVKSGKVRMVNKKNARVRVKDGKVTINKANVVKTDIRLVTASFTLLMQSSCLRRVAKAVRRRVKIKKI